ncbi:MAG: B12-binding domain-containing radical SAM protein, partial [Anaerolineae bacterium]
MAPDGAQRHRVVLYNPAAEHYTMPLALVAIASGIDRRRYAVDIVDARLEARPHRALLRAARGALAVGVTVLTGAPLLDALAASRAVKTAYPKVPVVWGGWHPSLFPAECARESAVDAVVAGQGEVAFQDLVESLAAGGSLPGAPVLGARRDLDSLPAYDYERIPVERYFALKGRRQLDYHSSQGCPYRCGFCADPAVFKRQWNGLPARRMLEELLALHRRYAFDEVAFQDELFFVDQRRAQDFARGLLAAG